METTCDKDVEQLIEYAPGIERYCCLARMCNETFNLKESLVKHIEENHMDCPHLDNGGGCELLGFRSCKDNLESCPMESDNAND